MKRMAKKVKPGKLRGNTTPNLLTENPNDYTLQLAGGMKYSLTDIVQLVLLDGATTETAQDLEESFRMVMEKGIEMSLMGNNVSLEYIQLRASVSGVFDSSTESFTRPKHEVNPVLVAGETYLEAAHNTLVENMGPTQLNVIAQVVNRNTYHVNTDITSGGVLELTGKGLKVLGSEMYPAHVYICDAETGTIVKNISEADLLANTPTHLMFQVPAGLEVGKRYIVKISTQATGTSGKLLKEPRLIVGDIRLTCV